MPRSRLLLGAAIAAYAAGFGALSVLRHRSFATGRFDLGNMAQAVWSTAHGDPLDVTNLAGEQTSRLASHFDPILVLFAPLWLVWPSPELLLVVQAVAIALGALPLFWLARKHLASEREALGIAVAYLLYPATQWVTLSEFHPVALACPLLLFAFWYLDEGRLVRFAIVAALAVATKEEIGLAIAGLGVWHAFAHGRRRDGAVIAGAGLAVAALAVGVVVPHFAGDDSAFFGRYDEVGGSPLGILETAVTEPWTLLRVALDGRGLTYLVQLLAPLAFLPLAAPLALLAAAPDLALNLLSSTRTQTSIHYHYSAPLIPAFFAALVFALERRPVPIRLLVALALVSNVAFGAIPFWGAIGGEDLQSDAWRVRAHDRVATRAVGLVPDDAVVSASNSLGGHLSARRRFLSFPVLRDATWIAVDTTSPGYLDRIAPGPYAQAIARVRRDPSWRLVFDEGGVLLFRRESSAEAGTP